MVQFQMCSQGWQVLPMPGFNHGLNPGLNRVGQNFKNPVSGQNWAKRDKILSKLKVETLVPVQYETQYGLMTVANSLNNKYIHQNGLVETRVLR